MNMNEGMKILTLNEMEGIAGGHPFEEKITDSDLYRAGIVVEYHFWSSDEFRIGSTGISKDLTKSLRARARKVWAPYAASGNYVDYAREWKAILANEYGITWNGEMGRLIGYCD